MDFSDIQKIAEIDLYEILNVSSDDDKKKIKKRYRKLVLKVHPDKPTGDKDIYELVNLAYTVLKNVNLRSIYDKERKIFLENNISFESLKKQSGKIKSNFPISKEDAKKEYSNLESFYNEKHGYNEDNMGPISQGEMAKRLNELSSNRNNFISDTKSKIKKMNLSKDDFNEKFIKEGVIDSDIGNDIIAFNDNNNSSLISYSGIDNFDLYNENGANSSVYSSLDNAFNNKLPCSMNNNYNNHNHLTNDDRTQFKNKMEDYNNLTNKIKNMKINDFN